MTSAKAYQLTLPWDCIITSDNVGMCGFLILTGERADMGVPFFPTCTCLYCLISEASSCPGLFRAHRSKFKHNDTLPDEVVAGCQANHSPVTRTLYVATGTPKDEIKGNARTYCLSSSINILIIIVGVPVEAHIAVAIWQSFCFQLGRPSCVYTTKSSHPHVSVSARRTVNPGVYSFSL